MLKLCRWCLQCYLHLPVLRLECRRVCVSHPLSQTKKLHACSSNFVSIASTESVPAHHPMKSESQPLTTKPPALRKCPAHAQDLQRILVPSTASILLITEHSLIPPLFLRQAQTRFRRQRDRRLLPRHRLGRL